MEDLRLALFHLAVVAARLCGRGGVLAASALVMWVQVGDLRDKPSIASDRDQQAALSGREFGQE